MSTVHRDPPASPHDDETSMPPNITFYNILEHHSPPRMTQIPQSPQIRLFVKPRRSYGGETPKSPLEVRHLPLRKRRINFDINEDMKEEKPNLMVPRWPVFVTANLLPPFITFALTGFALKAENHGVHDSNKKPNFFRPFEG